MNDGVTHSLALDIDASADNFSIGSRENGFRWGADESSATKQFDLYRINRATIHRHGVKIGQFRPRPKDGQSVNLASFIQAQFPLNVTSDILVAHHIEGQRLSLLLLGQYPLKIT